jgi:hypothetical protein
VEAISTAHSRRLGVGSPIRADGLQSAFRSASPEVRVSTEDGGYPLGKAGEYPVPPFEWGNGPQFHFPIRFVAEKLDNLPMEK